MCTGGQRHRWRPAARAALGPAAGAPDGAANAALQRRARARQRRNYTWPELQREWYAQPLALDMGVQWIAAEVVSRSQAGHADVKALYHLMRSTRTPEDAAAVLQALEAVRATLLYQGSLQPFSLKFASRFLQMVRTCGAVDVLVSAMTHAPELGLPLSRKGLHALLTWLGCDLRIEAMEAITAAIPLAGLEPSPTTVYILVRACVNAGLEERARAHANHYRGLGLRMKPTAARLLGIEVDEPGVGEGGESEDE